MGMIEQEYNELRQLMKDYKSGKITDKQVNTQIAIFSQMEKRQKNMINIQALAIKARSQKPINALKKANVIGNNLSLNLSVEETANQTIRCLNTDKLITRSQCLDYSGSHDDECQNCNHREITVRLLIDEPEGKIKNE